MNGVTFGNKHSYSDFGLILTAKTISPPEPKRKTIDLPGANGLIDLTEVFGRVQYSNRKLSFIFSAIDIAQWSSTVSQIMNDLHGRSMHIVLDEDPDYYYDGRTTVKSFVTQNGIGIITIECDCSPFKITTNKTTGSLLTANATVTLSVNKSSYPLGSITLSASAGYDGTVTINGLSTHSFSAGTNIYKILLTENVNTITFSLPTAPDNSTIQYSIEGFSL